MNLKNSISSIYKNEYINFNKEPMFLGHGKNSQRYDVLKYPIFEKLTDQMTSQEWGFDEVDMTKDHSDFALLPYNIKHTYTSVLQKLILLDSFQGRGMLQTLGSIISLPELEICMTEWQRFEGVKHSRSYTHILRSVYANPTEIFDNSFKIPVLLKIATDISKHYDNVAHEVDLYNTSRISDTTELRRLIYRLLLEINILEGIRFYSGFAAIWSMHYAQGLMERTGLVLKLICRDENIHLAISQTILKLFRTKPEEGFMESHEYWQPKIGDIYLEAYNQECEWIDFLFKEGSFLGMTAELMKSYLQFLTDKRLKAIGERELFGAKKNPLPWIDDYINYDSGEQLPQETQIVNYNLNILNKHISDSKIEELKKLL